MERVTKLGGKREEQECDGCRLPFIGYQTDLVNRAIVDLVVQGASTKEISQALYISEYTIQEYLSHVFDKVGVRGRRALLKRLFFDNLYPTLFA